MNKTFNIALIEDELIVVKCVETGSEWNYTIDLKEIITEDESFSHEFGVEKGYSKSLDCKVYFSHVDNLEEGLSREEFSQLMKMGQVEAQYKLENLSTKEIEAIFE